LGHGDQDLQVEDVTAFAIEDVTAFAIQDSTTRLTAAFEGYAQAGSEGVSLGCGAYFLDEEVDIDICVRSSLWSEMPG
jgi:hypothetical protein